MHEMQCVENVMSPGPKGLHTKSDVNEWSHRMNKYDVCVPIPSQTSSRMRKERNQKS